MVLNSSQEKYLIFRTVLKLMKRDQSQGGTVCSYWCDKSSKRKVSVKILFFDDVDLQRIHSTLKAVCDKYNGSSNRYIFEDIPPGKNNGTLADLSQEATEKLKETLVILRLDRLL